MGGVGCTVERLSDLDKCYACANAAFAQRYEQEHNQIVAGTAPGQRMPEAEDVPLDLDSLNMSRTQRKMLEQFIVTGMLTEIDGFLDDYFAQIGEKNIHSMLFRQYVVMDTYLVVQECLQELGCDKSELAGVLDGEGPAEVIATISGTRDYVRRLIEAAVDLRCRTAGGRYTSILKQAQEYIEQNYDNEEISLNLVAAEVGLSANHFSTIFGQETGVNFVEYLTRVRMEKAKTLLRTTQMRTTDIAFAVGYRDAHYFSSLFKKTQNCTPREYRSGGQSE